MRYLLSSIALAIASTASAATTEPIIVFGVPIGGALKTIPKLCPFDTDKAKTPCWVDRPYQHRDGSQAGALHLPNAENRPKWAAYATFEVQITRQGVVDKLSAKVHSTRNLTEIQESIVGRFGPSTTSTNSPKVISQTWARPDVHVKLLCSPGDFCAVELSSLAYRARYEREMEQRRATDAARPKTL